MFELVFIGVLAFFAADISSDAVVISKHVDQQHNLQQAPQWIDYGELHDGDWCNKCVFRGVDAGE